MSRASGLRVLIVERDFTGHRFSTVRVLIDALLALAAEFPDRSLLEGITVATSAAALASQEFAAQLEPVNEAFDLVEIPATIDDAPSWRHGWAKLRDVDQLILTRQYDHVYVPYGDGLVQMLGLFHPFPLFKWPSSVLVETILMRSSFAYAQAGNMSRRAALSGLKHARLARIHLNDPVAFQALHDHSAGWVHRVRLLPDPISTSAIPGRIAGRRALGLPEEGRLIGCLGRIDNRKGGHLLVESFLKANLGPTDRLLLGGIHEGNIKAMLARANDSRILSIDRYLTEQELKFAIGAIDLMATPYPDSIGSASMVIRAAAGNRMCLAADDGWMGQIVPQFGLGTLCRVSDTAEFADALEKALVESERFALGVKGRAFVSYHAIDNVHAHWTALIRERLGLPISAHLHDWPG